MNALTVRFYALVGVHSNAQLREIDIPISELEMPTSAEDSQLINHNLEMIFKYGQNDFQPRQCYSVSVDDIIFYELNEVKKTYVVDPIGFTEVGKFQCVVTRKQ